MHRQCSRRRACEAHSAPRRWRRLTRTCQCAARHRLGACSWTSGGQAATSLRTQTRILFPLRKQGRRRRLTHRVRRRGGQPTLQQPCAPRPRRHMRHRWGRHLQPPPLPRRRDGTSHCLATAPRRLSLWLRPQTRHAVRACAWRTQPLRRRQRSSPRRRLQQQRRRAPPPPGGAMAKPHILPSRTSAPCERRPSNPPASAIRIRCWRILLLPTISGAASPRSSSLPAFFHLCLLFPSLTCL